MLISHRLGAVRQADVIVVLAGGRIVERGSHDELLQHDGHYARLFHLQARGYGGGGQSHHAIAEQVDVSSPRVHERSRSARIDAV